MLGFSQCLEFLRLTKHFAQFRCFCAFSQDAIMTACACKRAVLRFSRLTYYYCLCQNLSWSLFWKSNLWPFVQTDLINNPQIHRANLFLPPHLHLFPFFCSSFRLNQRPLPPHIFFFGSYWPVNSIIHRACGRARVTSLKDSDGHPSGHSLVRDRPIGPKPWSSFNLAPFTAEVTRVKG